MLTKHCKSVLVIAGACSTMLFSGCTDDEFDLDNIDTTMQFEINDLALPLNLKPVHFKDLVDLTSEECIEVVNGEYVLVKSGTFHSEAVHIRGISASAIDDGNDDFEQSIPSVISGLPPIPFNHYMYNFSYTYNNVDKYIKKIVSGKVDLHLYMAMRAVYDNGNPIDCSFKDLQIVLPAGFYGNINGIEVNSQTSNKVTLPDCHVDNNGEYMIDFHVTSFDFEATGATLNEHAFNLSTGFGIEGGSIVINSGTGNAGKLYADFYLSDLVVSTFSGTVFYNVENLDPEDILLNDLPDVLTDSETKVRLKNPQLYIALSNPLEHYNITASTGLQISQIRHGDILPPVSYLTQRIKVDAVSGPQAFCLSPIRPDALAPDFSGAKWSELVGFGDVIYGDGLPEGLRINFTTPQMDEAEVVDFKLDQDLGEIVGDYTLYAPLELGSGSMIYYEDQATGWELGGDGDEEMAITKLSIEADVYSELPVSVTLRAKPTDSKGQVIPNVVINDVHIAPYSTQHIVISMEGDILDLDGMKYSLTIDAGQDTSSLQPEQSLILNNLKVRVSGRYIVSEDDDDEYYDY